MYKFEMICIFSGTCSTILLQPLDLVKTRIQQAANLELAESATAAVLNTTTSKPTIYSTMRVVIATGNFSIGHGTP